ncbi:hypothetical protein GCM10007301_03900 [Azorhizobium oxalatiphilum]|uniref:Uncharacterized protein n=1 Tax=Azorhizobium oxalatiphilum TaxID=980631 RepID=A0A917BKM1_9HYPH|nr:hypothetical protein [Azorhizobium oxalatiphilum]GGF47826.1 hypothetical protein GCM10007301_03900 [Azorhizobium oxalatiphilum]
MHRANNAFLNRDTVGELGMLVYERALAECLRPFLSELFYTNASVIIGYVHTHQDSNINDLIASSAELSLRPDLLRYGHNASISFDWGEPPVVSLDMEMVHPDLTVYFRIELDGKGIGVAVEGVVFSDQVADTDAALRRFQDVLQDSRLPA